MITRLTRGRAVAAVVADQAVSSISNVALTLMVASQVSPQVFGEYALVVATYLMAVAVGQALVGEPLLVATEGSNDPRQLSRSSLSGALYLGLAISALLATAASMIHGPLRAAILALAVALPGLLLQDALRFVAFARRRGSAALASDSVWAVSQIASTLLVLRSHNATAASLVLVWGLSGATSSVVTLLILRVRPASPRAWWRETKSLGPRYLMEAAGTVGVFQLMTYVVAAFVSVPAAGVFRLSQVIFGPVHVAYSAARAFLTPRLTGSQTELSPSQRRMLASATWALAGSCLALGAIYIFLPDRVGQLLLGDAWQAVQAVAPLVLAQKLLETLGVAPFSLLRARRRVRTTVRVRIATSLLGAALCVPAAQWGGLEGELLLLAMLSLISVTAWWARVGASTRERPVAASARPRVAILSHAYNTPSTASSLLALTDVADVKLLAPRRAKALVFDKSPAPDVAHVDVIRLRTLRLPRSQFLFTPKAFMRTLRSSDLVQIEYDPWSLLFWQALIWRSISGSRCAMLLVVKKNTFRQLPLGLHHVKRVIALQGLRQVDGVLATSEMTAALYRSTFGWPSSGLFVAPHLAVEVASQPAAPRNSTPTVLFVGQVTASKGIPELVDACRQLRGMDFETLRLVVVGPHLDPEVIVDEPWIEWRGLLSNEEVRSVMGSVDAFCIPARRLLDHEEHDGRALVEALASGLRCAGTDSGIIPELIRPQFGRIARSGDSASLAMALGETLLLDRDEAGRAAIEFAAAYASPTAYTSRRYEIYREVLACRPAMNT